MLKYLPINFLFQIKVLLFPFEFSMQSASVFQNANNLNGSFNKSEIWIWSENFTFQTKSCMKTFVSYCDKCIKNIFLSQIWFSFALALENVAKHDLHISNSKQNVLKEPPYV